MSLIQLKPKDLPGIREKWWLENNQCCPILQQKFPLSDMVVDHQHKLKSELPDESGKGICRNSIHRFANALEGKITNNFKRMGLGKFIDLPTFLRNLADYLESNQQHKDIKYIHPNEEPAQKKLTKKSYNSLRKILQLNGRKVPAYSGRFTKELSILFEKYNITPEFYI